MNPQRCVGCTLAMVIALVTGLRAQNPSPRESEGVVGPVRVVRAESVYARRAGDQLAEEGSRRRHDTVSFDADGNFSEREVMNDYGFPVGKETYTYREGRLTETVLADPKGALLERRRYSYASGNVPQSLAITARDGSGYVEQYTRGSSGRLEAIVYLVEGREMGKTVFTYEGAAELATAVAFFDASGTAATAPVGPCLGAHRLEYRYANGTVEERVLYEVDGTLKRRSVYRYDGRGNVVQEVRTGGLSDSRFTYEYDVDARGNWIRRIGTTVYGQPSRDGVDAAAIVTVTHRTITYY
jgi:hypothetical protein